MQGSNEEATANLDAIARSAGQGAFARRAQMNGLAAMGKWNERLEKAV